MSLRKAYQDMVKAQGIADTSTLMEMSESSIDNRIYERKGQEFTVRQALRLQQIAGNTRFAEQIAKESGGNFFKLPDLPDMDNESLERKFRELYTKLGRLVECHTEATADGEIDDRERDDLSNGANEIHRTLQELMGLTFVLYCRDGGKKVSA